MIFDKHKEYMLGLIQQIGKESGMSYEVHFLGYVFYSNEFERSVNDELLEEDIIITVYHHFKGCVTKKERIRPGRLLEFIFRETVANDVFPSQQLVEYLVNLHHLKHFKYRLIVDNDFDAIYSEDLPVLVTSCASGTDVSFYKESVNAFAARIVDKDNIIKARCVVFNDVQSNHGRSYRLAEKQYFDSEYARMALIQSLFREGYIEGFRARHEKVFMNEMGEPLPKDLYLQCLNNKNIAYMDTFEIPDFKTKRYYIEPKYKNTNMTLAEILATIIVLIFYPLRFLFRGFVK